MSHALLAQALGATAQSTGSVPQVPVQKLTEQLSRNVRSSVSSLKRRTSSLSTLRAGTGGALFLSGRSFRTLPQHLRARISMRRASRHATRVSYV